MGIVMLTDSGFLYLLILSLFKMRDQFENIRIDGATVSFMVTIGKYASMSIK